MGGEGLTETVPQHAHCSECGAAIPASEDVCGEACREEREARERKRRRWTLTFYGAMAVGVGTLLARILL